MQHGFFVYSSCDGMDDNAFDQFISQYLHREPPEEAVDCILQMIRKLPLPNLMEHTQDLTSNEHLTIYHDHDILS